MKREFGCKVSQHAVRGLGWKVFGAVADVMASFLEERGIDPQRVTWWSEILDTKPDEEGRNMITYGVRGKEII